MDEPADNGTPWKYDNGESGESPSADSQNDATKSASAPSAEVEWTASEFIERNKSITWYLLLAIVTAAIAALVYFASRDYVSTGLVIAIGIIFGVIASRKPRTLTYKLDGKGLSVGNKFYPYRHFKAFSSSREGNAPSLNFLPLKRFMPIMTIYYDPAEEEKILDIIGYYLPLENHQLDPLDKFLRKIRF